MPIPVLDMYEINPRGSIRKRDNRQYLSKHGPRLQAVMLVVAGKRRCLDVETLVALAFAHAQATENEPAAVPPAASVEPHGPKRKAQPTDHSKPKPLKKSPERRCVVCGALLPPGYWRRCPEHAFSDNAYSGEEYGGVAL